MPSTSTLSLVVAINPTASFGKGHAVGASVVSALRARGHRVTELTEDSGEALAAAVALSLLDAPDALVVVGGDGMAHLGANAVAGTAIPLGLVPSGTGNDMARALGIPHDDPAGATAVLLAALDGEPRTIDAGRIHYSHAGVPTVRWFAGVVSAGFDSIVNERANRMSRPRGASRYTIALVLELIGLTPISYRLELDDEVVETRALLVTVGNGQSIGGGMRVTPDALFDDGLFDVMVVRPLSRLSFLRIFPRVFKGTHVSDPRVTVTRVRRVRIESDTAIVYADGERISAAPVTVEAVPNALRVFA